MIRPFFCADRRSRLDEGQHLGVELVGFGLRQGTAPGVLLTADSSWADGVVGVRWDTRFAGNWEAVASADVGGGGASTCARLSAAA